MVEDDLFERVRLALSGHLDRDADGLDSDEAAREVLEAVRGATPADIDAALAAHPGPPTLSLEEALERLAVRDIRHYYGG